MSSLTGKLIVIEGLEGAGKSTAVNLVVELLSQKNQYYNHERTRRNKNR